MIVWRGFGILVLFIAIGSIFAAMAISESVTHDSDYADMHGWVMGSGLFVSAIVCWFWGRYLGRDGPHGHSLFFIPIQWWVPLLLVAGIGFCTINKSREDVRADREEAAAKREAKRLDRESRR